MAFGSRSYARPYVLGGGLPPATKILLIVNAVVFLLFFFGGSSLSALMGTLILNPYAVVHSFALWQPVTYMFVNVGVLGFVFNMLALWWFGGSLESSWGTETYLKFYFTCGIGAGLFAIPVCYLFGQPMGPAFSCTGPIFGMFGAYLALWPEQEVLFFFFPMKMKWFVALIAVVEFLMTYGAVGLTALISGLGIGWLFVKLPSQKRAASKRMDPVGSLRSAYRDWKLKRAKRKFQVYLKKQGSGRDPWVN